MTKLLILSIICTGASLAATPASTRPGSTESLAHSQATGMPIAAQIVADRSTGFHIPTPKPGPGWPPCVR